MRGVLGQLAVLPRDDEAARERLEDAGGVVGQHDEGAGGGQPVLDEGRGVHLLVLLVEHGEDACVAHDDLVVERGACGVGREGGALGVLERGARARDVEHVDGHLVAQVRKVDLHDVVRLLVDLLRVELHRRVGEDLLLRRRLGAALDGPIGAVLHAQRRGAGGEGDVVLGEAEALR